MRPEPASPPVVEPLGRHHDRKSFSSGVEALDRYLHQQAGQDARRRIAAIFVLPGADHRSVVGYYTLSATSIELRDLPPETARRLPRYPFVPATLIGRLAVDQRCRGQRWGEFLLMDALHRSLVHSKSIASMAMVVDAKDDSARSFYQHYHFVSFSDRKDRLFLPMKTIETLFA